MGLFKGNDESWHQFFWVFDCPFFSTKLKVDEFADTLEGVVSVIDAVTSSKTTDSGGFKSSLISEHFIHDPETWPDIQIDPVIFFP